MKRILSLLFACLCFSIFTKAANNIKDTTITYCDTIHYERIGSQTSYYRYDISYQVNLSNHNAKISQISALASNTSDEIWYLEYLIKNNYIDPNAIYVEIPETISINDESYTVDSILNFSYYSPKHDMYRGIKIPRTIKYIELDGQYFTLLKYLEWFEVDDENPYYSSVANCLCDKTGKVLLCYPVCQKEDITVPEGFEEIGEYAFAPRKYSSQSNMTSTIKTLRLSSTIKKTGLYSFLGNENLESVYVPSLSQWYKMRFSGSYGGFPMQNYNLYANDKLIHDIVIPDTIQYINYGQFAYCNLDTVIIPEGIKVIEQGAFYGSTIKSIYIPTTLDSIKINSFGNNDSLKYIHIKDIAKWSQIFFDSTNPLSCAHNLYLENTLITQVFLDNNISAYAFWGDTSLVSVNLGSNAKRIGEGAFLACSNLNEVTFNEGLLSIERRTFESCKQIKQITLPQSLLKIGEECFAYDSITTLIVPANVDTIGNYFITNNPIKNITFKAANPSQYSGAALQHRSSYHTMESLENIYIPCGTYDVYSNIFKEAKNLLREPTFDYSYQVTINNDLGTLAYTHTPDCSDSTLTIEVTPYSWAHFVQWSDGNTDNPRSIKVDHDITLNAELEYNDVTITLSCDEEKGTVSGAGTYAYNSEITITAIPKHGYKFDYWEVNGYKYSEEQTYTFYIVCDIDLVAQFKPEDYTVTVLSEDQAKGSVYGSTTAEYKSTIEIGAVANYGYHFEKWSDNNTDNPRQYTVKEAATLIAIFEPDTFIVHDYLGEDGYTIGGGTYPYLSEITVTAYPNYGYDFYSWEDGNAELTRIVTVDGELYLRPIFGAHLYHVTISVNDGNMGFVNYLGEYQFYYKDEIELVASPVNEQYEFVGWSDGIAENPRTIIIENDLELTANFLMKAVGLEDVLIDGIAPQKVMIDDILYIAMPNGTLYNSNGQLIIRDGVKCNAKEQKM